MSRITVAGVGAIGTTLAVRLASGGHDVSVLARGKTLETIKTLGLTLEDFKGRTSASVAASNEPSFGIQDYVFLCCKSQDLAVLAAHVKPLIGPSTVIVPVVNGVPFWYFHSEGGRFEGRVVEAVDKAGAIAAHLPPAQILGAVTFITAELSGYGSAVASNPHLMILGELNGIISERLLDLCELLTTAGITARSTERLRDELWTKLIANLTSNPLSVLSDATLEEIYSRTDLIASVKAVMQEALAVACAYGARLTVDPIGLVERGASKGAVNTSMLQDFRRGRPLELAAIGDAVVELAQHYDIPMPKTRALLEQVRLRSAAALV